MSKIVVVIDPAGRAAEVVAALRRLSGESVAVLKERLDMGRPVGEFILFRNDHDDVVRDIRGLRASITSPDIKVRFFELPEDQPFTSAQEEGPHEISFEVLANILEAHDREVERNVTGGLLPSDLVLIHVKLGHPKKPTAEERAAIDTLGQAIEEVMVAADLGHFDNADYPWIPKDRSSGSAPDGEALLYVWGRDCDAMWRLIEPLVRVAPISRGGYVVLTRERKWGEKTETRVDL
jgi:hypothetical protein